MENTSTQMFIAILFTIIKKGKQLIAYQPVTGKQNVINPRNGILFSHQKEWIDAWVHTLMYLENIKLSEISQAQKVTYCMIPFKWMSKIGKSMEIESRLEPVRGYGKGSWEWQLMSKGFLWGAGWWKCARIRKWCWFLKCINMLKKKKKLTLNCLPKRVSYMLCKSYLKF